MSILLNVSTHKSVKFAQKVDISCLCFSVTNAENKNKKTKKYKYFNNYVSPSLGARSLRPFNHANYSN